VALLPLPNFLPVYLMLAFVSLFYIWAVILLVQNLLFLITYIWWWYLQERLRKSKRLILEEAAKNKGFDLGNGELFY
jgi:ABC-type protease/lipase transport system fused ATPase/permease subunit